jgi:hypothetical protein
MPTRKEYLRRIHGPPRDRPWVWQPTDLLASDAWRAMSINARRLVDFLMVEHRNHAGLENGNLMAPYDQLEKAGLTRECIAAAINEAEFMGLIRVRRGGRYAGTNRPSSYRLTFYADKEHAPPTNDWKRVTADAVAAWRARNRERAAAVRRWRKNQTRGRKAAPLQCGKPRYRQGDAGQNDRATPQRSVEAETGPVVREAVPLIYLGWEGTRSAKPRASAARSAPDNEGSEFTPAGEAVSRIAQKLTAGVKVKG